MNWQETYDHAVAQFGGQTPGRQLEAELVECFEARPQATQAAIAKVAGQFASGRVFSPWAVLRAELARDKARAEVVGRDNEEDRLRAVRVRQAERFVAAAGYVLADEGELVDYFFSRGGWLEPWAGDELLRARMVELWGRAPRH